MSRLKKLTVDQRTEIGEQIKRLLHASRDAMRNRFKIGDTTFPNPKFVTFVTSDGYYGEAFGVLRTLHILGYGYLYDSKRPDRSNDLRDWFMQLLREVLSEEGYYGGTHECDYCLKAWGKDGAGRTRETVRT